MYNVKHTHTKKFSLVWLNVKKKPITRLYLRFCYLNILGVG